jgi:SepF-like predicted cell division protein (DUF552 family)
MRHLFSKGTFNFDGSWTMPKWAVDRWTKQMDTEYCDLSKSEQDSDRDEAKGMIKIVKAFEQQSDLLEALKEIKKAIPLLNTVCDSNVKNTALIKISEICKQTIQQHETSQITEQDIEDFTDLIKRKRERYCPICKSEMPRHEEWCTA